MINQCGVTLVFTAMRKYGLATDLETRLEAFVKEENL